MNNEITQNKFGYFSIKNLPTQKELEKYYADKYFQDTSIQYSNKYSNDELAYFKCTPQVADYIYKENITSSSHAVLDIGAGEGFFANYFLEMGWETTTLDYSNHGIKQHNPNLLSTLVKGDVFNSIDELISSKNVFNLINLSNILEHVIDPVILLEKLKVLLSQESLLRISVPNDYSDFQNFLLEKNYTANTWLCPPDHLHYFTFNSLSNLLESLDYEIVVRIGEFPIELFISNEASNYAKNRAHGKFAHKARIEVNNYIFEQGLDKYISYYKASAEVGITRQVVIFAKKKRRHHTDI